MAGDSDAPLPSSASAPVARDAGASPRLVVALALSAMLTPLNSTMLSVVLGPLGADFGDSEALLTQALVTTYLVTSIVMQAPSGRLGDHFGHRRVVAAGQLLFGVASVGAALSPSLTALTGSRILMAVGGALIVPSATALIRLEVPAERRGSAFGAFGGSMALAAAVGPLLGGLLTTLGTWRATFAANLVVLPLAAGLAGRGRARLKQPAPADDTAHSAGLEPTETSTAASASPTVRVAPRPSSQRVRFDVAGVILLGLSLTALVLAASPARPASPMALCALSAIAALAFVAWERRHPNPVIDLHLLGLPVLLAGGLLVALQNLAMYALLFELPSAVSRGGALGHHGKGLLLGAMMFAMVIASPLSGRLTDRYGSRAVAVSGTLLALAGMAALLAAGLTSLSWIVAGLVLLGAGLGLGTTPAQAAAMGAAPRASSGSAAALLSTLRYLGGVAGVLLLSLTWSAPLDPVAAAAEHQTTLWLFAAALVLAAVCATRLPSGPAAALRPAPPARVEGNRAPV